jgi:hypothetical protein
MRARIRGRQSVRQAVLRETNIARAPPLDGGEVVDTSPRRLPSEITLGRPVAGRAVLRSSDQGCR